MKDQYQLSAYDYFLPEDQIAQHPAAHRDTSRLLVLDRVKNTTEHRLFAEITALFRPGDLLVVNNSRVFPARLLGRKETGGRVEILLLHFPEQIKSGSDSREARALALVKSSKRPRPGSLLSFGGDLQARVDCLRPDGKVELTLLYPAAVDLEDLFQQHGQIPLPPYIRRPNGSTAEDVRRYQTRYASSTGSVAAPTAGLHFSSELITRIEDMGVKRAAVTLHVGYGTFAPVRTEDIRNHQIHEEYVSIPEETARVVNQAKDKGNRIWAVGTTTARTLEFGADDKGWLQPVRGLCGLYIYPDYPFTIVNNLITNFHLPQSSLLFLVSALAGRENILDAYGKAVARGYRFFSYGDAMAIITR